MNTALIASSVILVSDGRKPVIGGRDLVLGGQPGPAGCPKRPEVTFDFKKLLPLRSATHQEASRMSRIKLSKPVLVIST
jgi:hypothetical protein